MDSRLNIALVGYGKFGRKYYSNIKSLNNFNLKVVFKKKIRKKFLSKNIKLDLFNIKNLKKYNIDCAIIATSINSHYKIAKVFLKRKIPIIIEKPVTSKVKEIKDLIKISKKNKVTVLVNHSDLYNNDFEEILKHKKKIGKINFLEAKYGKYQDYYKGKNFLPFFDWFSHPLAVISKFVSLNVNPRIVYNKIIKKMVKFSKI